MWMECWFTRCRCIRLHGSAIWPARHSGQRPGTPDARKTQFRTGAGSDRPHFPEDVNFEHGAAKERLFRKMLLESTFSDYSVPGFTEFLKRHPEIPKAVASNAEPANIDFVLDRFHLTRFFPVIVDGFEANRPKPFPDIYLKAAERLRHNRSTALFSKIRRQGLKPLEPLGCASWASRPRRPNSMPSTLRLQTSSILDLNPGFRSIRSKLNCR